MAYVVLLAGTALMFNAVPRGFIPTQDKLYLIAGVKLPEGSSLERTDAVLQRMKDVALATDGVAHVIGLTGFNPTQQTNTPNYAVAFPILKPFNERRRSAKEIAADIQANIAKIKEGFAFVLNPPPVLGLGQGAGYSVCESRMILANTVKRSFTLPELRTQECRRCALSFSSFPPVQQAASGQRPLCNAGPRQAWRVR